MTARPNKLLAYFKKSLVARFVVSIALPVLLVMTSMSVAHYWRERRLLEDQIELAALQMGEVFRGSLRHAMLANDGEMIVEILQNMDGMENILQVRLINLDGWVVADSSGNTTGQILSRDDAGCIECHRFEPENRPHTTRLAIAPQVLRITTPIANEADCRACHAADDAHLGVLVADVSLIDIERHLEDDLRIELLVSAVMMGVVMATIYLLVHRLVVRRMLNLREPLARLSGGDFSVRLPVSPGPEDEVDRLAKLLNRMAEA
ncbi:MAG: HAMP domain-containing protein, partial [Anaerolineae bacterium]